MSRPIKFRAWDKESQRIVGWQEIHDQWGVEYLDDGLAEIMQFTGRTDRTGTEVYEGDIIEYQAQEDGRWITVRATVKWADDLLMWDTDDKYRISLATTLQMRGAHVVGNIWENGDV